MLEIDILDELSPNRYRIPPMPHWLGKFLGLIAALAALAALGVLDGHLMLAQSWAWATRLKDRTFLFTHLFS